MSENSRLDAVRAAVDASGALRMPGGAALAGILDLMAADESQEALDALAKLPDSGDYPEILKILRAILLDATEKREDALSIVRQVIGQPRADYDELCVAGDLLRDWKMPAEAAEAYDRAIALAPHASHAFLRRGRARSDAGDITRAIEDLRRATLLQPNFGEAHRTLGDELRDANMLEAAIDSYRRALSVDPADEAAEIALDAVMTALVPPWHAAMLNDRRRNDAFDAAIRAAVARYADAHVGSAEGMQVLDIGTGTGLLAMMAVRAGAGHVTACEAVAPLAEVAREIVALNGMEDRIAVQHKRSTDLAVGTDLPRRADLLTAEIVDAGLLSEGVLSTLADARNRLLAPQATVIPRGATVFAMPIESAAIDAERRVGRAAGFNVTPFNRLAPMLYLQKDLSGCDWRPLSGPVELFRFDFSEPDTEGADIATRIFPRSDGTAHAIALWFRLNLDDEISIATGPMDPPTHWQQAIYSVDPPLEVKQNEPVRLRVRHDGRRIRLSLSAR